MTDLPNHVRVAIVGSGFSGLGMAIRLKQEGINDFVVLERADDVGGTWQANTYPGIACDIPSNLYSFSFAPNPDWSRTFSPGGEIWDYLRDCVDRFGIRSHIRFGHDMIEARWDEEDRLWHVETSKGSLTADVLVTGMGVLAEPSLPAIAGIDSFQGRMFHSATWDHDYDLAGKRVAVIGTGASTIQIVPEIAPKVGQLYVFQRTAPWIVPHHDRPVTKIERRLFRLFPPAQRLIRAFTYWARESFVPFLMHPRLISPIERAARRNMHKQVDDPELRRKLTPNYRMGCKRILMSSDYYPALQRPNVELVTDGISELRANSIVTADGTEREVDAVVLGTGFHVADFPWAERLVGRGGEKLSDVWRRSPQAYAGTTVAGFPNMFVVIGPNTGLGHNSLVFMIESQVAYILDCLHTMNARGIATVEVREEAQTAFNDDVQQRLEGAVWTSGGCASWYLDANGRNATLWPGSTWTFRKRTRHFDLANYSVGSAAPRAQAPPSPAWSDSVLNRPPRSGGAPGTGLTGRSST